MKIGIFTDTYYPQINGVATSVFLLKENLEGLGHQVYVFTTTDVAAPEEEKRVYRIPSLPFVSERRLGFFYQPRLAKIIRKLNLDIIHTQTEFSLGIFGRMMAKELNIPLVHTYHTIYEDYTHYIVKFHKLDSLAKVAARKISASFCNSANMLIVPTNKVKNLLLSYGIEQDIAIIPTGIKLDKFSTYNYDSKMIQELRTSLGIEVKDKVVLYIGRVSKEKNIEEILINLQVYLEEKNDVKLLVVGDGPTKSSLEELAKQLGIEKQVIFAGEKPWHSIGAYYQLGDVFVSASQSETQGLTYIEALASGVPVVAKLDPCLEGVLQNNVNGYTFCDKEEFLEGLNAILYNDYQKEKLSHGAIQSVKKFSVSYFSSAIEKLYIDTISREQNNEKSENKYFSGEEVKKNA